jgi:hypothetical protein
MFEWVLELVSAWALGVLVGVMVGVGVGVGLGVGVESESVSGGSCETPAGYMPFSSTQ